MNKTLKFLVSLVVVINFISCEKKIGNIDFSSTIKENIVVHVDQTMGTPVTFNTDELMSLDNTQTHDYLDRITAITINSLSYQLKNFSGDSSGTATVTFYIDNYALYTNTNINVKNTVDSSEVFTITDATLLNQIAEALLNNQKVTAKYIGDVLCEESAMDFEVAIKLVINVTAGVL